jgi:hypothetical protein
MFLGIGFSDLNMTHAERSKDRRFAVKDNRTVKEPVNVREINKTK